MIRLVKWALVALGAGWAVYSLWGIWAMGQMFRAASAERIPALTNALSGLQLLAITLGPLLLATGFLFVRWPYRSS